MMAAAGLEAMQLTNLRHCRLSGAPAASRPRAPRLEAMRPGGGGGGEGASSSASAASFSMLRVLADSAVFGAVENAGLLWSAVEAGAARVQRTLEPPPPGFPPGEHTRGKRRSSSEREPQPAAPLCFFSSLLKC